MLGNFIQGFSLSLSGFTEIVLSSPSFTNLGELPLRYTCFGMGISPPLEIKGIKRNVKALALTFRSKESFLWVVYYISPELVSLPEGVEENHHVRFGINDFGVKGYTPPCPTEKKLYEFTLYSLADVPKFRKIPTGEELIGKIKSITLSRSSLLCYVSVK